MKKPIVRRLTICVGVIIALNVIFSLSVKGEAPLQGDIWQRYRQQVAAPVPPSIRNCWGGYMCSQVVTGTAGGTYIINGTKGSLNNIQDYHTATFDQWVLSRTDTSVTVELTSRASLDTQAGFPVDSNLIPIEVLPYLQSTSTQQSNNTAIINQAQALTVDTQTEAQAVVAILDWVRANIAYDYSFSLPTDAVSVYNNRSGVCSGFSNLSVALLRSVGIPAKVQTGCALWSLPEGGGHAWIEVYYPDTGWVPSEPQSIENFVDQHLVSSKWWEWCGKAATAITYTERIEAQRLYLIDTPYQDNICTVIDTANVTTWDRHPLKIAPDSLSIMLPITNPVGSLSLQIENLSCGGQNDWQIRTEALWLSPDIVTGTTAGTAQFTVNASGMHTGSYTSLLTLYGTNWWWPSGVVSRTITADLRIVDKVYHVYLPFVARKSR